MRYRFLLVLFWVINAVLPAGAAESWRNALDSISATRLLEGTRVLASDEMEGRGLGTAGEERATTWIASRFKAVGLEPGGPGGSWFQEVPLVGIRSSLNAAVRKDERVESLVFPQDIVAWSPPQRPVVTVVDSELVFVGYGVVAPEYDWDDFKDVEVRGKTLVILVNDPPIPDPADPTRLDPQVFRGNAMTYYGRWTYKFEMAAQKGAAAALIVHETGPAGYPWFVVVNSWGRENFSLVQSGESALQAAGWLSLDAAQRVLTSPEQDFESLKRRALRRDFRPVSLGWTADLTVTNTLRRLTSRNVVGQLPGSDPDRRGEWIIYTAHWDHLGRDDRREGGFHFQRSAR